ncbi:MAG: 2-amino-4-hydroxy-6-hydroxymethyldihydropteridine diphosphokinase [Sulfuricella denitrificans]|nr:2-amino-4-hydroxy-6-hydroxymethyldihydropteridine diphosphokinase [Sulfuricella denitrificans]
MHAHATRAFIALGSNLDDPADQVSHAFGELDALPGTRLIARSSLYRSAPWGYSDQPDFINAVAEIETRLEPRILLEMLLEIEHRRGRVREFLNAPRTLDLDLLLYDGLVYHEHGLTLPHPRMHERAFVLMPLTEIAPGCVIPGQGAALACLARCAGQELERLPQNPPMTASSALQRQAVG